MDVTLQPMTSQSIQVTWKVCGAGAFLGHAVVRSTKTHEGTGGERTALLPRVGHIALLLPSSWDGAAAATCPWGSAIGAVPNAALVLGTRSKQGSWCKPYPKPYGAGCPGTSTFPWRYMGRDNV